MNTVYPNSNNQMLFMRVEVSIAKEKAKAMPKGSLNALTEELTKRLGSRYEDVEVIVKAASNAGLCFALEG